MPALLVVLGRGLIRSAYSHLSDMDKGSLDFSSEDEQELLPRPSVHLSLVVDTLTLEVSVLRYRRPPEVPLSEPFLNLLL